MLVLINNDLHIYGIDVTIQFLELKKKLTNQYRRNNWKVLKYEGTWKVLNTKVHGKC